MSDTLDYLKTFAGFPFKLRKFLRQPLSLDEARRRLREQVERRTENFLHSAEQNIYNHPSSPYLALLKSAGCELGDLRALVQSKGLESTLIELRENGVYVTFEEFKGRKPILRNGLHLSVTPRDFDNPSAQHDFSMTTGGSTGLSTTVGLDLEYLAASAPAQLTVLNAYGILDAPYAHWIQILPGPGFRFLFLRIQLGQYPEHWFSSQGWFDSQQWWKYDTATLYMYAWTRLSGAPVPFPEIVPLDRAEVVARWVHQTLQIKKRCVLHSNTSHGLRVCVAAQQAGLDLTGATFRLGGEPITPAKAETIRRSGVRLVPGYGMVELGAIGYGCVNGEGADDVHLAVDKLALITYPYALQGTDITVPAFNLTTLYERMPKLMLNVQVDDYGIVEERACGCDLESAGCTTHLREIRSYSKLLSEGVTLIGNEMVHILEHVLPARFGGTQFDYQLLEQEDAQSFTRLYLVISPRVQIADEQQVLEVMHSALAASSPTADSARVVWQQAQTIQIKRQEPVWTERGKFLPLHIQHNSSKNGKE